MISDATSTELLVFCVEGHTVLEFGLSVAVMNAGDSSTVTLSINGVAHAMTMDTEDSNFQQLSLNYRGKIAHESEVSVSILTNGDATIAAQYLQWGYKLWGKGYKKIHSTDTSCVS